MADLNFPNPGVQQTYTFVGKTWNWDGQRWAFASSGSGITKLNELTSSVQNFLIGYSGAFPNIVSSGSDHTFNFPIAGTAATGLVNTSAQTFAGAKTFASTTNATYIGDGGVVVHGGIAISGNAAIGGSAIFTNTSNTNTIAFRAGIQGSTLSYIFPIDTPTAGQVLSASAPSSGVVTLSWEDDQTGAPAGGITQLNGLTAATQSFQTGTDGVDFGISSTTATHTFNLPDASASARGVITTGTQTIAGAKTFSSSIVGNLTGTATTAQNLNTTAATAGGAHYLLFSPVNGASGVAVSSDAQLQFNPGTNVLTVDIFSGNLSATAATATNFYGSLVGNVTGTATTAQNVNTNVYTNNNVHYLTFTLQGNGAGAALSTSNSVGKLTYRPADEQLSVTNITGTAFTATNFYGTHVGNVTGTATTSQNLNTVAATTGTGHYLLFSPVNGASGVAVSSDAQLQFSPSTNVLTTDTFSGNLSATAATATNFYGTLVGNSSTAITSQNVNTVAADSAGNQYLIFSPTNGGSGVALSSDGGLTFVSTTNVLTTNVFSGNLSATGATVTSILDVQGDAALGNATGDTVTFNARIGSHFNPSANTTYDLGLPTLRWRNVYQDYVTGVAVTATNFYGTLTGNSSTATTSANLNTVAATTGTGHYILFSPVNGSSGVAVSSDAQLLFSPSTNVLTSDTFSGNLSGTAATVTNFYGSLTGNVTGTATTAQNVNTAAFTNNNVHYITFTLQGNGAGAALSTSNSSGKLTYRPSDEQLSVTNITGTAFTATNFYGTHVGSVTGNVTGTATTSQNLNTVAATTGTGHYLLFSPVNGGSGVAVSSDAQLQFSPATNVLTVDTFSGNLSATAATATNFYGTLVGNSSTATTSQNVNTVAATTGTGHYLLFSPVNGGSGVAISSDAQLQFSPATNVLTVDTFSGNLSGTAATVTNFYGALTGNVTGTATTAQNVNTAAFTNNNVHYITFTLQGNGAGAALSTSNSSGKLTYRPSDEQLSVTNITGTAFTATNFYGTHVGAVTGNVTGTATTAQNLNTVAATTGTGHYLLFSPVNGGSGIAVSSDAQLQFSPATNVLTVDTFSGNLSGTAATVTNFYGTLTGNVTGTATTAQNVNTNVYTNNSVHYLTFTLQGNGAGAALSTSNSAGKLTYRPADEQLSVTNITGTAFTATNFYGTHVGSVTGNVTGTATTAQNVNTVAATTGTGHYLLFSPVNGGSGVALSSDAQLQFSPSTNVLTVDTFSGNLSGTAATATNFYGTLTGNVTGTATTAQNLNTVAAATGTGHYLLFSPTNGGSGIAVSSDAQLQFSPATNVLTADIFSGNLSGTAATATNFYGSLVGTATTSQNVNVNTTTAGGNFYLTFTNQSSGSGLALTTSTIGIGFTVNPAQNTLAAGTFIGNVSGSATTSTYITGILRNASYVLGDLLAGASTGNTLTRVPVGANDRYFLKPDSTTQSGLGWSTFAGVFVTSLAPASPAFTLVKGDLWYKVDDGSFNVYYDVDETAQWVEIVSSGGPGGGTATTSENVNVNTTTINQNHYLLFSNRSSGSGVALTTSTIGIGFTVNPAENSLSAGLFAGNISGTAATFANIYGNTFGSLTGVEFSGGDVLIKTGKSLKIYEANNVYNTSFKANSSLAGNTDYTLPVGKPGTGASILQSDTAGSMIWVKAASNKATYVLSFGAGFTPTTGLDSVSIAIPYANDGSTSLTYTIKRVEVRTETEPGASTLAFYFERHTAGNAIWTVTPITIKGAASANFSVAQNNYVSSFTTITSSSGNNGEVASGNYLRVNFASVGTAANVSISIMIQEN